VVWRVTPIIRKVPVPDMQVNKGNIEGIARQGFTDSVAETAQVQELSDHSGVLRSSQSGKAQPVPHDLLGQTTRNPTMRLKQCWNPTQLSLYICGGAKAVVVG
jgi:hypothetical protein